MSLNSRSLSWTPQRLPFQSFALLDPLAMLLAKMVTTIAGVLLAHQLVLMWVRLRRRQPADILSSHPVELCPVVEPPHQLSHGAAPSSDNRSSAWQTVQVHSIRDESPDCRSFRLLPNDNEPLPTYRAGQYITVRMRDSKTNRNLARCYSLSGGPGERGYRITVKRVPGGEVSNWLHDHVRVGDHLEIQQPRGRFHVNPALLNKPLVLVAAGIGITPMLSMLLENLERSPRRTIHLFYQLRTPENAPFLTLLRGLAEGIAQTSPDSPPCFL